MIKSMLETLALIFAPYFAVVILLSAAYWDNFFIVTPRDWYPTVRVLAVMWVFIVAFIMRPMLANQNKESE